MLAVTDCGTNLALELKIIYIHFSIVAISSQAVNHLSVSHAAEKKCVAVPKVFLFSVHQWDKIRQSKDRWHIISLCKRFSIKTLRTTKSPNLWTTTNI